MSRVYSSKQKFTDLFRQAIDKLADLTGNSYKLIREELARAVNRRATTIEYWERKNNLTFPKQAALEKLAEAIYVKLLDPKWVTQFLVAGQHPTPEEFANYLIRKHEPSQAEPKGKQQIVGRDKYISEIVEIFQNHTAQRIVTIDGIGGIGKTAVAEQIHDYFLTHPTFEQVIWLTSHKYTAPHQVLAEQPLPFDFEAILNGIGQHLGVQQISSFPHQQKKTVVYNLLKRERYLIILDNMETVASQQLLVEELRSFLDPSCALITSRRRFYGNVHEIHLQGLNLNDAIALMKKVDQTRAIYAIAKNNPEGLQQLHKITGGSPLAIKLIVGLLRQMPLSLLLKQFTKATPLDPIPNEDEYLKFYELIFKQSLSFLTKADKKLLLGLAQFALGEKAPFSFIEDLPELTDAQLTQAIRSLWRLSLIEIQEPNETREIHYYLHPLTHHFVSATASRQDIAEEPFFEEGHYPQTVNRWYIEKAVAFAGQNQKEPNHLAAYRQSLYSALDQAFLLQLHEVFASGANYLFPFWDTFAEYELAVRYYERCGTLSLSDKAKATALFHHSCICEKQGLYEEAKILGERGLHLARQVKEKRLTADLLWQLGRMKSKFGAYAEAEALTMEGLELARTVKYQERIGWLLNTAGHIQDISHADYEQARLFFEEGLEIGAELEDSLLTSTLYLNLGTVDVRQGQFKSAKAQLEKALAVTQAAGHREQICFILLNIVLVDANILHQNQAANFDSTLDYLYEAIQVATEIGHQELLATAYMHLGSIMRENGRFDQANEAYEKAHGYNAKLSNPALLMSALLTEHAELFIKTEQWNKVWALSSEALEYARSASLPEFEGKALFGMAQADAGMGNLEQAEKMGAESLAIFKRIGNEHADEVHTWLLTLRRRSDG